MSLLFLRILLLCALCKHGSGTSRVNQGVPIDVEDAPYMARVQVLLNATLALGCDASIISEMHLLTAGHCATDESNINVPNPKLHDPSAYTILIGTDDVNEPERGEFFRVSKVYFREYSTKNDMAILKLSTRIMLDGITKMAITLPTNTNYYPRNRTNVYVDGWGKNPQHTSKLLRANIYTISAQECVGDRKYQICTLGDNGAGPCQGDSGGPLLRADDGVQIGLVSFVPLNCAHPGQTQSTFTAIAPNLGWIRRIMNGGGGGSNQMGGGTVAANYKPVTQIHKLPPTTSSSNVLG